MVSKIFKCFAVSAAVFITGLIALFAAAGIASEFAAPATFEEVIATCKSTRSSVTCVRALGGLFAVPTVEDPHPPSFSIAYAKEAIQTLIYGPIAKPTPRSAFDQLVESTLPFESAFGTSVDKVLANIRFFHQQSSYNACASFKDCVVMVYSRSMTSAGDLYIKIMYNQAVTPSVADHIHGNMSVGTAMVVLMTLGICVCSCFFGMGIICLISVLNVAIDRENALPTTEKQLEQVLRSKVKAVAYFILRDIQFPLWCLFMVAVIFMWVCINSFIIVIPCILVCCAGFMSLIWLREDWMAAFEEAWPWKKEWNEWRIRIDEERGIVVDSFLRNLWINHREEAETYPGGWSLRDDLMVDAKAFEDEPLHKRKRTEEQQRKILRKYGEKCYAHLEEMWSARANEIDIDGLAQAHVERSIMDSLD